MKFNHLNVPDHWRHYWSRYPEGYTILEALISWVNQVDDMVDNQNKLNADVEQYRNEINASVEQFRNEIDAFVSRFDERLQAEVSVTLEDWQASGFLDVIITEAMQWQLDEYITQNEQDKLDITTELGGKLTNAQYVQEDFIETLLKYYSVKKMYVVANSFDNKNFSFIYDLGNGKGIRYLLSKNGDGFAILKAGQLGDFNSETKAFTNPVDYLADTSNKEFAFNLQETGTSESSYFIPTHNQQATAFDLSDTKHILDGAEIINSDLPNGVNTEVTDKYTVIQYVVFRKPNTSIEIGRATVHMVFNSNGRVDINTTFKPTINLTINYGYVNMLPVSSAFGKKMLTSYGNKYTTTATDGSRTMLTEKDLANSYVFINDSPTNNIAVAMTMQRQKQTMRVGKEGRPGVAPIWIEHRSTVMQKLYPMPFSNAEMSAGEVYSFGGSYLMAKVENVNTILA